MLADSLLEGMERARRASHAVHGRRICFYLPGMFWRDGRTGRYPALSVTGTRCLQGCAHCGGKLLEDMLAVPTPDELFERCRTLQSKGIQGVLVSGGCLGGGRLPWKDFLPAIARIKQELGLFVSVHSGMLDRETARGLKASGADQVLLDVAGSPETYAEVLHLPGGLDLLRETLAFAQEAGLDIVPHVIAGLHFGQIRGEERALEAIAEHAPKLLCIVSWMPIPGTAMQGCQPPQPEDVCALIVRARELMPQTEISLGCARERGRNARKLELLALATGVNRMALPSDEAVEQARAMGLAVEFRTTCCSAAIGPASPSWDSGEGEETIC